jgi:hypothetical protein
MSFISAEQRSIQYANYCDIVEAIWNKEERTTPNGLQNINLHSSVDHIFGDIGSAVIGLQLTLSCVGTESHAFGSLAPLASNRIEELRSISLHSIPDDLCLATASRPDCTPIVPRLNSYTSYQIVAMICQRPSTFLVQSRQEIERPD